MQLPCKNRQKTIYVAAKLTPGVVVGATDWVSRRTANKKRQLYKFE